MLELTHNYEIIRKLSLYRIMKRPKYSRLRFKRECRNTSEFSILSPPTYSLTLRTRLFVVRLVRLKRKSIMLDNLRFWKSNKKLRLYPTCDANENGQNISIFLELFHANGFDSRKKVHTTFSISIKDQFGDVDRKLTNSFNENDLVGNENLGDQPNESFCDQSNDNLGDDSMNGNGHSLEVEDQPVDAEDFEHFEED
uniref:Uncharacterized protein n=1 Tax=Solanum tuberosum TaxID=4113 RepID=M1DSV6_SOLTU